MKNKNDDEFDKFAASLEKAASAKEAKHGHLTRLNAELEAEKQRPVVISLWVFILFLVMLPFMLLILFIVSTTLFGLWGLGPTSGLVVFLLWELGQRGVVIKR